jgi:hypothetical protein
LRGSGRRLGREHGHFGKLGRAVHQDVGVRVLVGTVVLGVGVFGKVVCVTLEKLALLGVPSTDLSFSSERRFESDGHLRGGRKKRDGQPKLFSRTIR